jgi:transposase-like protein
MPYTDEQKAEAVRLYVEEGPEEAAAAVGCSRRQVYRWLGSHNVTPKKPDQRRADTESRHIQRREELRDLLLDQALDMLHRMNEMHIEWREVDGQQEQIVHLVAGAGEVKSYALAAGILIDKYRLEMGEATSRTISEGADDIDRSVAQLVAELARRRETSTP